MKKYSITLVLLLVYSVAFATPDVPGGGGQGGDNFGTPASPIDMYIIGLLFVAISMIVFMVKSKKLQNNNI